MPVPVTPGSTAPTAGVVGDPELHASEVCNWPTVWTNVAVSAVPETVAVIETDPGVTPSVTCVFAWPAESVVAVAGETDAAPAVTAKLTVAPRIGAPFAATRTTIGS